MPCLLSRPRRLPYLGVGQRAQSRREKVERQPELIEQRKGGEDLRRRQDVSEDAARSEGRDQRDRKNVRSQEKLEGGGGAEPFALRTDHLQIDQIDQIDHQPGKS